MEIFLSLYIWLLKYWSIFRLLGYFTYNNIILSYNMIILTYSTQLKKKLDLLTTSISVRITIYVSLTKRFISKYPNEISSSFNF